MAGKICRSTAERIMSGGPWRAAVFI